MKQNDNQKLLTYNDVAEMAGVSSQKVRSDRKARHIFCVPELLPKVRFTEQEAKEYAEWASANGRLAMDFDLTQPFKILPTMPRVHKFFGDPSKYSGGINLAISERGTFINLNRMKQITPYKTGNGHLQITLHNGLQPCAHDLVNLVWNDNSKWKPITHHINNIKTDNRACNLISLFYDEHEQAHKLMNAIKTATSKAEKTAARKEYRNFIKEMRADNKEKVKEDLRVIDNLDFPTNEKHKNYMIVTEKSWQKYLQTGNDNDLVVRGEYFK